MDKKKIVSIEDRIPKLKLLRKKKANRRLMFFLSIFIVLISLIVYLQSPLSNVKTIQVEGNSYVSTQEVIEMSELTTKTNIWTVKQTEIEDRIKVNPVIKTVEVLRKLPRTVEIFTEEYQLVGYIKKDAEYYPIIEDGTILTRGTTMTGDAPIVEGFTDEKYFDDMIKELQIISKSILNLISEIHWQPTEENQNKIMLYMNDGYVVNGTIRNFAEKMQIYPSIVSQLEPGSKGVIHIGVGAYFEKYNNNETDEENDEENEENNE